MFLEAPLIRAQVYIRRIYIHREKSHGICSVTVLSIWVVKLHLTVMKNPSLHKIAVVLSCVYGNGVTKTVNIHDSHSKLSEQRLLLVCNASVRAGGRKLCGPGCGPSLSSCWPEAMCRTIMQQERGAIVIRASPKLGQELI